jgi:tetratricopeptide (TPR) repeat protein
MMARFSRSLACAAIALSANGCGPSTPFARYGGTARYSAHHRGYVITLGDLADAPSPLAQSLLLRDPLTDNKIRCREQLLVWLPAQARATDTLVRSEYDLNRSLVVMLPFTVIGSAPLTSALIIAGAGLPFILVAEVPHFVADYPSASSLYRDGASAFRAGRYDEARKALETSIALDPARGRGSYALSYLGYAYEQMHEDELAREALTAFVERASVANAAAYQVAEDRLARLGGALPACASTDAVPVAWGP